MSLIEAHSENSLYYRARSLRSGRSPYSPKGSFGEPAAGSTSPSASTRPREFVFVFAVRSSCACVCLFDCLFLCVPLCFFGWLVVCGYMVFLRCLVTWGTFWYVFFASWVSFLYVLWRPWGSIVAPGAPFWEPWATCCRFSTLFAALGLNFDTPGLHVVTLWRPFWCLFEHLGQDPGPFDNF